MPQYHLPMGTEPAQRTFAQLDSFTRGYIEAMFWTECNEDNEELASCTFHDLAPPALAKVIEECTAFQNANEEPLEACYAHETVDYDDERAGHDFWLTRNGHGAGFWCRDLGDDGDKLTAACKACGECYVHLGDDEKVHIG